MAATLTYDQETPFIHVFEAQAQSERGTPRQIIVRGERPPREGATFMASIEKKSFAAPDERRTPSKTTMDIVRFGDRTVARITYHPGWRWSSDIKPPAGTDLCQVNHFLYVLSGQTHVVMADGTELDLGPGDVATVPAGHDGWVVGDEPCVFLDFGGAVRPA